MACSAHRPLNRNFGSLAGLVVAMALLVGGAGCGRESKTPTAQPAPSAEATPAGKVRAVHGAVQASREGAQARTLKVDDPVFADDTVNTAAEASVTIALNHNGAVWTLLGGRRKRVDQSAAWRAKKGSAPLLVARRAEDLTVAAGRHSEGEAATSEESAQRPAPSARPQVKREAKEEPARAPRAARKAMAKAAAKPAAKPSSSPRKPASSGVSGLLGGDGGGGGSLNDALMGGGGGGVSGGGISGLGKSGRSGASSGSLAERRVQAKAVVTVTSAQGSLPKATINKLLRRRLSALRSCYERTLRTEPDAKGSVQIQLVIEASGRVSGIKIKPGALADAVMTGCLSTRFKTMRFPPAADGKATTVELTVVFSPQ